MPCPNNKQNTIQYKVFTHCCESLISLQDKKVHVHCNQVN